MILLLLLLVAPVEILTGRVVGITDGDTLTLLVGTEQHKIRLYGIDCPEKAQPFGTRARQSLSDKIFGKTVRVEIVDKDRYGRKIGIVKIDGRNVNLEMVRDGMAWWYYQYAKKSVEYAVAEQEARRLQSGLWIDQSPIPPWQWRKKK